MRKTVISFITLVFITLCLLQAESPEAWGSAAARKDMHPTVTAMLEYAAEDEYLARAEYNAIIKKFGTIRPFSNIVKSEETHIAWIIDTCRIRNISLPEDRAEKFITIPGTVKVALQTGVEAELNNIAMYQSFLYTDELSDPANGDLKDLFTRLMNASQNHLAAFRKGLADQ
jgi:hypothetical protein